MLGLRKNTLGKNKFFGYQKERIIKCQQVSLMARRWCNIPKTFFLIHLCEAPDFDEGQDCWPLRDSVFIPMYSKRVYKQTWKIKKSDQFLERLIPPCCFFLAPRFPGWIPSWNAGTHQACLFCLGFWDRTGEASVPPLLWENGKTPVAYLGGDWYSM